MYVKNFEDIKSEVILCSRILGEYLEKKGIPVLSKSHTGNMLIFVYTEDLKKVLGELPEELKKEGYFIE